SVSEIIGQGQGITGWVALYAKPQRIPDVSKDPRYVEIRKGIRSELAVPMELMGNVIGVVNCDSDRLDAFSEQDLAFLSLLTNEASKAVGRIWLLRQLRSKAAQLEALVRAAQGLACPPHPRITGCSRLCLLQDCRRRLAAQAPRRRPER
ncbi:MAG: hypothetical protein RI910_2452, partial [Verrucomicrobiota bacterium]